MKPPIFFSYVVLAAACAKVADAPKPAEPVAVGAVDAPPMQVHAEPEPELAPVKIDAGGPGLPPTGDYDVIARIISDDCSAREPAPPRVTALVVGRAYKDGRIGANMPLPRAGGGMDRSDLGIEPRKSMTSTLRPDRSCPSYTVERTLEITAATHDVIRVMQTSKKSDPTGCGKPGTACTTKVEYTYGLVKELCAAGCNPKIGPSDGGLGIIDCTCVR